MKSFYYIFIFVTLSCQNTSQSTQIENEQPENKEPPKTQLSKSELQLLKPGDIILRNGDGSLSTQIIKMMEEDNDISHCGVIVKYKKKWNVVHAIGGPTAETDGVQLEDLQSFVSKTTNQTIYIARPIFGDSLAPKISYHALKYASQKVPFDYLFDLNNEDRFGCTELIYRVFKDVSDKEIFEIEDRNGVKLLHFTTFFDTTNFTKVLDLREDQ